MTYKDAQNLYTKHKYVFRTEKMRLNIFGIRSKNSQSNKFDDLGGIAWIDEDGKEQLMNFWMTTDPGKYWLQNPFKKEGCIIMVPGQYLECYTRGLHANKYDAFKQCRKMAYVRDGNKDTILDFDLYRLPENKHLIFWDMCGTNFHRASQSVLAQFVERYSAGCQVVQKIETWNKIIELRDKSISYGFKYFDYTLFEE